MIKILTVNNAMPDIKNYNTLLFENVFPILKQTTDVHLTWLIVTPNKIKLPDKQKSGISILDIHDYHNAVEIIKEINPDLIYVFAGISMPDYSLAVVGNHFNIPIIGGQLGLPLFSSMKKHSLFKNYLSQFFENSISSKSITNEKQSKKRRQFFFYKHKFLLNTLKELGFSRIKIIKEFIFLIRTYLILTKPSEMNAKFHCVLQFVESEKAKKYYENNGFDESKLVVVGNPTYDKIFQKIKNSKLEHKKNKKIQILFLTVNFASQGGNWTKLKRNEMIKKIVTEINKNKDKFDFNIKIHPTGENILEYRSIINNLDPSITIFQEENILDILEKSDVIVTSSSSTAGICALLLKKPVIIWNFFEAEEDVFIKNDLALECKKIEEISSLIDKSILENPATPEKMDQFISEFLYKNDGNSAKRIAELILKISKYKI